MRSLPWPLPSTLAGSLRTLVGRAHGGDFSRLLTRLKQLACHGPLPFSGGELFVPAPQDALLGDQGEGIMLRPESPNPGGTDLPNGLLPALPSSTVTLKKFRPLPSWWSMAKMTEWLTGSEDVWPGFYQKAADFRCNPAIDERTHVQIDPRTLAATPHMLFSSAGLVLDQLVEPGSRIAHATELLVRVSSQHDDEFTQYLENARTFQTIGGERRMAEVRTADASRQSLFDCPIAMKEKLNGINVGDGLRMVLATPAIFKNGWRPMSPDESGELNWTPPGLAPEQLTLSLVAVCNQRWEPVSGWSYETRGPKPVKRMVPAGAVYFFRVKQIQGDALVRCWLQPVSDDPEDCRDGFGLALWGTWKPQKEIPQQ